MKKLLLLFVFSLFFSCGKKSFDENSVFEIKFNYQTAKVEFVTLTSNIAPMEKVLNGKPASRVTVMFSLRNASKKSIELRKNDFNIYLSSQKETYSGDLFRSLDDISNDDLSEVQEQIIMPDKNANFYMTYWLPYSTSEEYFKEIKWQINGESNSTIDILLRPTFGVKF